MGERRGGQQGAGGGFCTLSGCRRGETPRAVRRFLLGAAPPCGGRRSQKVAAPQSPEPEKVFCVAATGTWQMRSRLQT